MYKGNRVEKILLLDENELEKIKKYYPERFEELNAQEEQIKKINKAESEYEINENIDFIISFWEHTIYNGGLLFPSNKWNLRLIELYIADERYEDALKALEYIKVDIELKEEFRQKIADFISSKK